MKKTILLMLIVLLLMSGFALAAGQQQEKKKPPSILDAVTRTYNLKYISPRKVEKSLESYFWRCSYDSNGNMITVKIAKENIPGFEKMLKQLDVEKQRIMLRIFTVIASNEGKGSPIENKDLQKVLNELQKVLSFKSFRMDGVSALIVTDGQRYSQLKLSSRVKLNLNLNNIYIRKNASGRVVGFEFRLGQLTDSSIMKDTKPPYENLIHSQTSVKEGGYLVAGVSKIGQNGDSLVLVINATMQ